MRRAIGAAPLVFIIALTLVSPASAQPLKGDIGHSEHWGSGWIDLKTPTDFKRGDKVRLKIGGSAKRIIVRFLPKDEQADDPVGIEGGAVPLERADRTVDITFQEDHLQTKQISVHGGTNPWGLYPLGEDNGPATLLRAERLK